MTQLYSLEMIRNTAAQPHENGQSLPDAPKSYRFYLFDYFDRLACITEGDYREHFGFTAHKTVLTEQHITLKSTSKAKNIDPLTDPFAYGTLPDHPARPYLFCIFVQLFPGEYTGAQSESFAVEQTPVDKMRAIARRVLPDGTPYEIYHQFNAGDFCLALRTDDVQSGYQLANAIRTSDIGFGVTLDTYTIVGIEEPRENQFSASADGHNVVLRLSIRDMSCLETLHKSLQSGADGNAVTGLKGLAGRYDATLTLTLTQFQQLYPYLWESKFGKRPQPSPSNETADQFADPVVRWIYEHIGEIEFINERLLIDLPADGFPVSAVHGLDPEKVRRQNDYIQESLARLKRWTPEYGYWNMLDEFGQKLRMVEDVWNSFSNLRFQGDSCINGNMFFAQMCLVLLCIEKHLQTFDAHPLEEETPGTPAYDARMKLIEGGFRDLFAWISTACTSMHNFNFRLQSINRQSFQAPIYECQMHMDPEKYLVAYTEFARLFLSRWGSHTSPKQNLLPFFSIDFNQSALSANPLFLLPYDYAPAQNVPVANEAKEQMLLAINIPDTDSLARIYDMLPLITHELSHNLRVVDRAERNEVLVRFVFAQTANYIVTHALARNSYFERCFSPDRLHHTLAKSLGDLLWEKFDALFHEVLPNQNIGALISTIKPYLVNMLACFCEQPNHNFICVDKTDLSSAMAALISLLSPENQQKLAFAPLPDGTEAPLSIGQYLSRAEQVLRLLEEQTALDLAADRPAGCESLTLLDFEQYTLPPHIFDTKISEKFADMENWYQALSAKEQQAYALWHSRWLHCYMRLKDANALFQIIHQYRIYGSDKVARENDGRIFLKDWFARCQEILTHAPESQRALWEAFLPNDHLNRLGLRMAGDEVFERSMVRTLQTVQQDTFYRITDESTSAYREVFADLGMCAFCGFHAFGYLRFFSRKHQLSLVTANFDHVTKSVYHSNADMSAQRIQTVCLLLLHMQNDENGAQLLADSIAYLRSAAKRLQSVEMSECLGLEIGNWIEALIIELTKQNKDELNLLQPSLLLEFSETAEEEAAFRTVFREMEYLYEFAKQVLLVLRNVEIDTFDPVKPLVEHFISLYPELLQCVEEFSDTSHVTSKIETLYNDPVFILEQELLSKEFEDVLQFVQHYYFRNWEIYANTPNLDDNFAHSDEIFRKNQETISAWISTLIAKQER